MSDLISRSGLLKQFCMTKDGHRIQERDCDNFEITVSIKDIKRIIREQPTSYDIDKVVEDLESYRNEITCDIDIDNAIEIVKQGGISDDVCEWKLKDVCYTSSIKHYDALPTSIVKTFTSCPYCGKKIKAVE